jgi:hypothetical protein
MISFLEELLGQAPANQSPTKRRNRRRRRISQKIVDPITLGGKTAVIVKPTTRDSELVRDDAKDALRERVQRIRKYVERRKNKRTRVILKPRLRTDVSKGEVPQQLTEEQAERLAHCRQAMAELNAFRLPVYKHQVRRILRVSAR